MTFKNREHVEHFFVCFLMKEREILRVSVRPSSSSASFSGSFAPPDLGTLDRAGLPPAGFPSSHHILAPWSHLIQRTRGTLALCYFWSASIGKKALDATPPSSKDAVKRGLEYLSGGETDLGGYLANLSAFAGTCSQLPQARSASQSSGRQVPGHLLGT